jgi:hypothetical protein
MENTFINKAYEYDRIRKELREEVYKFLGQKLNEYKKIDLTENSICIEYNGNYVQAYEIYVTPNGNMMLDVEEFGSIRVDHLMTDDLKNVALDVHENTITRQVGYSTRITSRIYS